jgi:hypothetical protein
MNITLHWYDTILIIVVLILLFFILKPRESQGGYLDFTGCIAPFFILVLIVFIAIWGGIFWW